MAAFLNLVLPLGIVSVFRSGSKIGRVGWGLWSVATLILIFFTSSRGGWLGTVGAVGALLLMAAFAQRVRIKTRFNRLLKNKSLLGGLVVTGVVVLLVLFALLDWELRQTASTHSSTGLSFLSRSYIWAVAWDMFRNHALFGNGPFTFGTQYILYYSVPPSMLLAHAHNFIFNVAAEAGLIGLAGFGWLMAAFLRSLWRRWNSVSSQERLLFFGLVASLAGITIHSLFDTPELIPSLGLILVSLVALVMALPSAPFPGDWPHAKSRFGARKIILPGIWLLSVAAMGWNLWSFQVADLGLSAGDWGDWKTAAADLDIAAGRDPFLALSWFQAGYAHGHLALDNEGNLVDSNELALALDDYQRGLALEGNYATNWVNVGILDWAAGNQVVALQYLQKAAQRASGQPAFTLTYARMLEQSGRLDEARTTYLHVLNVVPSWADSYYFRETPFRLALVAEWRTSTGHLVAKTTGAPSNKVDLWEVIADADTADNVNNVSSLLALGQAYHQVSDYEDSIATFERALGKLSLTTSFGIGQSGQMSYEIGIYDRVGFLTDLLPGVDYILYTDDVVEGMLILADDYLQVGDTASAVQVYQKILEVAPDNIGAQSNLKALGQ